MEKEIKKEELVQETEIIEEEALKADSQKTKKLLKKILIGTGAAAILGGIIAAVKSAKEKPVYDFAIPGVDDDEETEDEDSEDETVETSEN